MNQDLYNIASGAHSLVPKTRTASENGAGVSVVGYESAIAIYEVGANGDTLSGSVKKTPSVEESDDDTTYTAVAAADLIGALPVIDANAKCSKLYVCGYKGTKKYIRVVETIAGTHTNGTPSSACIVRGHPRNAPVTQGT